MRFVAAYGLIARCKEPVQRVDVERVLAELARRAFAGAEAVLGESTDRGSLVSGRAERFTFFNVSGRGRTFCLCRFRHFEGGLELVFNLSDSGLSSGEVDDALVAGLPVELVHREMT